MIGKGISTFFENILYTERGRIVLSIILGLGLATLFRKFCDGKNCYNFVGPKQTELKDKIYSFDSGNSKCYTMRERNVGCGSKSKTVEFA